MPGIYFDHNATTPVLADVVEAMLPFFQRSAGNPSSAHGAGMEARTAIERARSQVAELVGAPPSHVVFTATATEAINTAFHSALSNPGQNRSRIVISAVEHAAVRQCAFAKGEQGAEIVSIPVALSGELALDRLARVISDDTCLVSVMWANNETGVVFPIAHVAQLCADRGVPLHVDAVQAAGKLPIDLDQLPIDYLSISAHKLFGPKGVGALIASPHCVKPLLRGGNQEAGLRAGTENVPAIVGFGQAARLASLELCTRNTMVASLRDRLEHTLCNEIKDCYVNGMDQPRISNTTNMGFIGVDGDALVGMLDVAGIHASTGSACSAGTLTPSHVVMAMTDSYERAGESIRFSLSHLNTDAEIDRAISTIKESVDTFRLMNAHA
jgi:cysteine desulfurase